jgi:hypothetical protein
MRNDEYSGDCIFMEKEKMGKFVLKTKGPIKKK